MSGESKEIAEIYRDGMLALTEAYGAGMQDGADHERKRLARASHDWLLNSDERVAKAARDAVKYALLDAAEAWEKEDVDGMKKLAEQHYRAGGPSMPTIWLRLRAGVDDREDS